MTTRKMLVMAGLSVALWVGLPGTAWASHCPAGVTYPASCAHGAEVSSDAVAPFSDVQGSHVVRTDSGGGSGRSGGLPVTGGDVVGLTIMGLGAVGIGTLLVQRSRRIA